jgi:hypothetical protein
VKTELGEARIYIQRAAALAAHWGLQDELERMLAEMIVEAKAVTKISVLGPHRSHNMRRCASDPQLSRFG